MLQTLTDEDMVSALGRLFRFAVHLEAQGLSSATPRRNIRELLLRLAHSNCLAEARAENPWRPTQREGEA